jgi:hypothetical protein
MAWVEMRSLAKLLRDRKPIPDKLADFIANAIDGAENAEARAEKHNPLDANQKAKVFTNKLGLTSSQVGARSKGMNWQEAEVEHDFGDFSSERKAKQHIAKLGGFGVGTAGNRLKQADKERQAEVREMQEAIARGERMPD